MLIYAAGLTASIRVQKQGFRYAIDEGNEEGSSKKLEMDDLNKFSALNSRDDYGTGSLTKDK